MISSFISFSNTNWKNIRDLNRMIKFIAALFGSSLAAISSNADRETAIRIQLLEWQIGIANSSGIARDILEEVDDLNPAVHPRSADHTLVRFKVNFQF